jgi:2-polyprenyl-3-methyl-5-hydroxy-6-metoxy-1,4-benzoquinol methylase
MSDFDIYDEKQRLRAKNLFDGNLVYGAGRFHRETSRSGVGRPASGYLVPAHAKVVVDTGTERYERIAEFWEEVPNCPVCASTDQHFFLHRMGIDVFRCGECGHRFQNPRIKFDKIVELYSTDVSPTRVYNSTTQKEMDRHKYGYGLQLIDQLNKRGTRERIMDIGCGAGGFLFEAEKSHWRQCVGVDINSNWSSNYTDQEGVFFINSTFEELGVDRLGAGYDVVSMWNVLEHIYEPHTVLESIHKLLADDGLFVIMVPNVESLASRLMREMSPSFNWKHVSHFCKQSLDRLLCANGFVCEHVETVITEIDNIKSYMSGQYPYHGYGDPEHLFDFITPEYIHSNFLGSRILAVYRRI